MQVTLIADTVIRPQNMKEATGGIWQFDYVECPTGADALTEFAGRACYQSWHRPNPKTRTTAAYVRSVIAKGHESITAHASATFYVTGVTRNLTHELIRHRFLAVSELSQRYVPGDHLEMALHPTIEEYLNPETWSQGDCDDIKNAFSDAIDLYNRIVDTLRERGISGKAAREAARGVLPGLTETRIVVTGNMRAWRDFIRQRWHVDADAEIRTLAGLILAELRELAPNTFADIPEEPYSHQPAARAISKLTKPFTITITDSAGHTYTMQASEDS